MKSWEVDQMAVEVEMNRDIREFEPKIISVFTARQLYCVGIGILYAVPLGMMIPTGDFMYNLIIMVALATPAILSGWVKIYGMYFDKFFLSVLLPYFLSPQVRKYKTENTYETLLTEAEDDTKKKKTKKKIHYVREERPYK